MSDNGTLKASIKAAASRASIVPRRRLPDYAVDGLLPQIAVSVIPWGGGTAMATGGIPRRYDVALDITRLNRVVEHVAEDLTVVVQAGARLQELQEHLAHRGQYLPLDPPLPERATIGGILASNAGGPWRHSHGWPRDWLLGMKVALPDGSVIKSGGRVVKNVAGSSRRRSRWHPCRRLARLRWPSSSRPPSPFAPPWLSMRVTCASNHSTC
jgi:FAD/FMN-containing dehydrogenase